MAYTKPTAANLKARFPAFAAVADATVGYWIDEGDAETASWPRNTGPRVAAMPIRKPQQSLKDWTKQDWQTKSGKPSSKTGERYLPKAAIKSLTPAEYAATTKAKRKGKAAGKQFVKQPEAIAKKTARFR